MKLVSPRASEDLTAGINHQQREGEDTCLTASEIAAHFILDLYSEGSSYQANRERISVNSENVADELLNYSKRIRSLESIRERIVRISFDG